MVFSSIIFLCVFLPVMLIGFYLLPKKAKNVWLLIGSLFFCAFGSPQGFLILAASVAGNYLLTLLIAKLADEKGHKVSQKLVLAAAVLFNLGLLIYFKYFTLLCTTVNDLFSASITIGEIILPIGISFYTFQAMSYLIDVYRYEGMPYKPSDKGMQRYCCADTGEAVSIVERNPINYALYITFFPQILQGPIVRYHEMRDKLHDSGATLTELSEGIERFIVGLAKKALIANTLGEVADSIMGCDPAIMGTSVAWLGAICYTLQIYFDFSGYSDMAIGLGEMFGFKLPENFNYPYISRSITEFWRRWHITLSSWFRDYLYIPLGGNRSGNVYVNLLIVFLATGIWHGAAWGFLVWGLWHGLFMLIERALKGRNLGIKIPGIIKWIYSMLVVTLGWVLFKLEDLPTALSYIGVMFHTSSHEYNAFSIMYYLDSKLVCVMIIAVIAMIPWAQILPRHIAAYIADFASSDRIGFVVARRAALIVLLLLSFVFVVNNTYSPFIYFQF